MRGNWCRLKCTKMAAKLNSMGAKWPKMVFGRARMENPLKLKRIHHIEFWVGNARQAAYFYRKGFGFSQVAYSGLETGQRQRTSYALSQGKANFVLTTPMTPDDLAADHIRKHGDGVRDIALEVDDADQAFAAAVR